MTKNILSLALGVALLGAAETVAGEPEIAIPADVSDPAFDRYLDLKALSQALADGKADAIADCALKLAEGERALGRKHKGISSDKLLRVALGLAREKQDEKTMRRIGKAAKEAKDDDLAGLVEKLVGPGRKVDPDAAAVAQASPAHAVVYRTIAEEIRGAKSLASRSQLEKLKKQIDSLNPYDTKLKEALRRQVGDALGKLPPKVDPETDVLARLASASRGGASGYTAMRVTLINGTDEEVPLDYATKQAQKKPAPLAAKENKTYSLQFVKGKPAEIIPGKGAAATVKDGGFYQVEKSGDKYVLKVVVEPTE